MGATFVTKVANVHQVAPVDRPKMRIEFIVFVAPGQYKLQYTSTLCFFCINHDETKSTVTCRHIPLFVLQARLHISLILSKGKTMNTSGITGDVSGNVAILRSSITMCKYHPTLLVHLLPLYDFIPCSALDLSHTL